MNEPLCDSCGEWTDPATLIDGDCPGCWAVRPDKTEQALEKLERKWRKKNHISPPPGTGPDASAIYQLDAHPPITPEYLRERGFVEPE